LAPSSRSCGEDTPGGAASFVWPRSGRCAARATKITRNLMAKRIPPCRTPPSTNHRETTDPGQFGLKRSEGESPMETIIGIDLGTTNSEVAIIRDGQPVVLEEDGDPTLGRRA